MENHWTNGKWKISAIYIIYFIFTIFRNFNKIKFSFLLFYNFSYPYWISAIPSLQPSARWKISNKWNNFSYFRTRRNCILIKYRSGIVSNIGICNIASWKGGMGETILIRGMDFSIPIIFHFPVFFHAKASLLKLHLLMKTLVKITLYIPNHFLI